MSNGTTIHDKVLVRLGKKTYAAIATELGISRSAVAGIAFRHRHPGVRSLGTGKRMPTKWQWPRHVGGMFASE